MSLKRLVARAATRVFGPTLAAHYLGALHARGRSVRTVRTLAAHLEPAGRLVVAEHVGLVTHDAGFRRPIASQGEEPGSGAVVTKRVRSPRAWRGCAREAGLAVLDSSRRRKSRGQQPTSANRLLVVAGEAYRLPPDRNG
jgi:hypothetical protein